MPLGAVYHTHCAAVKTSFRVPKYTKKTRNVNHFDTIRDNAVQRLAPTTAQTLAPGQDQRPGSAPTAPPASDQAQERRPGAHLAEGGGAGGQARHPRGDQDNPRPRRRRGKPAAGAPRPATGNRSGDQGTTTGGGPLHRRFQKGRNPGTPPGPRRESPPHATGQPGGKGGQPRSPPAGDQNQPRPPKGKPAGRDQPPGERAGDRGAGSHCTGRRRTPPFGRLEGDTHAVQPFTIVTPLYDRCP